MASGRIQSAQFCGTEWWHNMDVCAKKIRIRVSLKTQRTSKKIDFVHDKPTVGRTTPPTVHEHSFLLYVHTNVQG